MESFAASWEVGARCRRLSWLLHASVVEAKHAQLARAFKAGFNPNQPRVPAGNSDGGQWTGGGGGGQTQVAQNLSRPARGSGLVRLRNGQLVEATPAQEARLAVAQARAEARAAEVRQLDPTWRPTPSFTETIEGEILGTCETRDPGTPSGNFVPDHQPPNALNSSQQPQRLYPQCLGCSQGQGGWTRSLKRPR
jgi:hypothetical protein